MAEPQPVAQPAKVTVYDALVARPGEVTPEKAAADPERFQAIGTQTVRMLKPDGTMVELPATSALTAASDPRYGYQYLPDDAALHEGKVQQHLARINNAFDVGAREFINQLSFGVAGTAEQHTRTPEELEAIERANQEHRTVQVVGGGLGAGLGIAATEGLGELAQGARGVGAVDATMQGVRAARTVDAARALAAAEHVVPTAVAPLAERAVIQGSEAGAHAAALAAEQQAPGILSRLASASGQGMLTGAKYALPQSLAQVYYGDPEHAAESLMWGIGTGGILGLGGAAISEGLAGAANKLKGPLAEKALKSGLLHPDGTWDKELTLRKVAENDAKRIGFSNADWNKMTKKMQDDLLAEIQKDPSLLELNHEQIVDLRKAMGEKIGEHAKVLDAAVAMAPEEIAGKLGVSADDVANQVQADLLDKFKGLATVTPAGGILKGEARFLQKDILPTIMSYAKGGKLTFGEIQQLKNVFSKEAVGLGKKAPAFYTLKDNMLAQTLDTISRIQTDAMDEAYKALPLNKGSAEWLSDKTRYGVLKDIERMGPQASDQYGTPLMQSARQAYGNIPASSTIGKMAGGAAEALGRGVAGGAVGAVAGPWAGMLAGAAGGRLSRGLLGPIFARKVFEWTQGALRAAANGEGGQWLGAALAKDASAIAINKTLKIPTLLADGARRAATMERMKQDVLKDYLGPKANGLTKDQQFQAVGQALDQSKQQPDRSKQEIEALSNLFGFDPRLRQAYAQKNAAALDYLYNAFPRRPGDPPPFSGKDTWKPSPAQKKAFLDSLEVVNDPHSVLTHALHGDLTDAHVRAISTLYPAQKNAIVEQIWRSAYDPRTGRIPEGLKMSLERLTGVPMSQPNNYQTVYQQQPQTPGGGGHHRGQGAGAAQTYMTPVQKLATK